jgi:hypothetical protein
MIDIIGIALKIIPYVCLMASLWKATRTRDKGEEYDHIVWLLWTIIWLLIIITNRLGV